MMAMMVLVDLVMMWLMMMIDDGGGDGRHGGDHDDDDDDDGVDVGEIDIHHLLRRRQSRFSILVKKVTDRAAIERPALPGQEFSPQVSESEDRCHSVAI